MDENPYQPPLAPLTQNAPPPDQPRRRFRFRVIPATLCFIYGGLLAFAFVVQIGLIAWLAARVGPSRVDFGIVLLIMAGLSAFSAIFLFAGWLFLRGKWLWAVTSIALAFGAGFGLDRLIRHGERGDGPAIAILRRIVKPN